MPKSKFNISDIIKNIQGAGGGPTPPAVGPSLNPSAAPDTGDAATGMGAASGAITGQPPIAGGAMPTPLMPPPPGGAGPPLGMGAAGGELGGPTAPVRRAGGGKRHIAGKSGKMGK